MWEQDLEFYFLMVDGLPMSVVIDLAAAPYLPLRTHDTALQVRVPMHQPFPNGLRSDEEFDALSALEDDLVSAAEQYGAIYWGRHIRGGRTDFFFQVAGTPQPDLLTDLDTTLRQRNYEAKMLHKHDPDWDRYRDSYPSPFLMHTISNRALQAELKAQGDRLEKRRPVDHSALFPGRAQAEDAARRLRRRRFRTGPALSTGEGSSHMLAFRRRDSCDGSRPDQITEEILDAIEPSGGTYDGWGCRVR